MGGADASPRRFRAMKPPLRPSTAPVYSRANDQREPNLSASYSVSGPTSARTPGLPLNLIGKLSDQPVRCGYSEAHISAKDSS